MLKERFTEEYFAKGQVTKDILQLKSQRKRYYKYT